MVYVGSESEDKNGTTYKDIVMFNPFVKDSQRLITAKNAKDHKRGSKRRALFKRGQNV